MKIGILTQKLENNYGGILQNYALQSILIQLGHNPETIDFRPGNSRFWYIVSYLKYIILRLRGIKIKKVQHFSNASQRSKLTSSFIEKNIRTTKRIHVLTPLLPIFHRYRCIIVGSDQVWREKYNVLRNTFLSFVPSFVYKIAYAASFGVSFWEYSESQTNSCRKWVKRFKAVSVREESGVSLCKQYLDIKATNVLDPTMLLSKDKYNDLCKSEIIHKEPFLFAYILDLSEEKRQIVEHFANNKGLEIVLLSSEKNITHSVESWLSYFRDASYVLTDSFHGTVFSIIYEKPFSVIVNSNRGADRFDSLLGKLDLKDRIITGDNSNDNNIDWKKVSNLIEKEKKLSISFLSKNLLV